MGAGVLICLSGHVCDSLVSYLCSYLHILMVVELFPCAKEHIFSLR